ncbi:MAG TPA: helix-turn-helix domain-containing protein [Dermatophilaceae bacterium]|nr:helix-turn-helix domain-containing protein [Dermatophilaceae bacterium]
MTRPPGQDFPPTGPTAPADPPASQTLDRGLRVLEHVAAGTRPLTTLEVARDVDLHRSIAYRMLRTLEARRLVARNADGAWLPGSGLAVLASNVVPDVRLAAQSALEGLANETRMTAFLVIRDHDEAVTASVVEPRTAIAHVTYRPGRRHLVTRGAPGIALLAGGPPLDGERAEVTLCRERGWAFSESEVLPGMKACSAPVISADGSCSAAISVVFVSQPDLDDLGARVVRAALAVSERTAYIEGRRA